MRLFYACVAIQLRWNSSWNCTWMSLKSPWIFSLNLWPLCYIFHFFWIFWISSVFGFCPLYVFTNSIQVIGCEHHLWSDLNLFDSLLNLFHSQSKIHKHWAVTTDVCHILLFFCCQHIKINHENVKPHLCPVCNKGFPYASYLAEHMPVHDVVGTERRYACEHCDKSFVRKSGLRKHMKEEHLSGPKPFVCPHCNRRYAYRCALEGHMRRHSSVRPFACLTCGAGFKHLSNLQKHEKVSLSDCN